MIIIPPEFSTLMSSFSREFTKKTFVLCKILLTGAILTRGARTVCGVLRTLGLSQEKGYCKYHRVLSRASWCPLNCSKILLSLLISAFYGEDGPLVFAIDDTIERRWGKKIKKRGIYRDPVRSSESFFVKCSGLRWMCVGLIGHIKWADRFWALPFLSCLCPSERFYENRARTHKKLTEYPRQLSKLIKRWAGDRKVIFVGDGGFSCYELLGRVEKGLAWITRMRMDSAFYELPGKKEGTVGRPAIKGAKAQNPLEVLNDEATGWEKCTMSEWYGEKDKELEFTARVNIWYKSGMPPVKMRWVLIRDPEKKLAPAVVQSTDWEMTAKEVIGHFVSRWAIEVSFEEVRRHLGVETQRQWSDKSIERTTPILMALFSIVALWADSIFADGESLEKFKNSTAWYKKKELTFSDALCTVRKRILVESNLCSSLKNGEEHKLSDEFIDHLFFLCARAA